MSDIDIASLVDQILEDGNADEVLKDLEAVTEISFDDKKFRPNEGPQTEAYFSEADILLYGGQAGGGKDLEVNTLVPVPLDTHPSGYKKHGDLVVGDLVYGKHGEPCKVVGIPLGAGKRHTYKVTFSTGEEIVAGPDHLWETWSSKERGRLLRSSEDWREKRKASRSSRAVDNSKKPWVSQSITKINQDRQHDISVAQPSVRTTKEISDTLCVGSYNRLNHSIDVVKPVIGDDIKLPCEPYLFGLWLGDGMTNKSTIVMMEDDWVEILPYLPKPKIKKLSMGPLSKRETNIRNFSELACVRKLGEKHIPIEYLRGSFTQRLELLRGMMDTDGTADKRGQCELGFSNKKLADDALELINSLGIKCTQRTKVLKSDKHADHYRMKFVTDLTVFKLPRKIDRQVNIQNQKANRRYIVDVQPNGEAMTNCIAVEGGLYCVGRSYIVTHNSALVLGLALNEHQRSLIIRRQNVDVHGLVDSCKAISGDAKRFTGGPGGNRPTYNGDNCVIHFEGYGDVNDIGGKQGVAHDFIGVDEAAQLPENAIKLLVGWNRTVDPNQRCRVVLASNPPLDTTGDWMISYFGPWLDETHYNPAMPGELRWFNTDEDGRDVEASGPDDFLVIGDEKYYPQSRTFIPASVDDNPYIDSSYKSTLNSLPEPYRSALRDGNFLNARQDSEWQCIPTEWVKLAQKRWKEHGKPDGVPQCAMAVDVAQGGADNTVLSIRYDGWFDDLLTVPGADTPDGPTVAGLVLARRRGSPHIVIDMGGGYGGATLTHLKQNNIPNLVPYKGASKSMARTNDKTLKFTNKRSESIWRLREALDPSQDGGSPIMLPNDPQLLSDLCSPTYDVTPQGIKVEPKEKLKARIGRSPDKGDAVVMCWNVGLTQANILGGWQGRSERMSRPNVVVGHANKKKMNRR